jgi:putative ABC transport system ATP-binding protein
VSLPDAPDAIQPRLTLAPGAAAFEEDKDSMPGDEPTADRGAMSVASAVSASPNLVSEAAGTSTVASAQKRGESIISVRNVDYTLDIAGRPLNILKNVDFDVAPAQVVAIVGPSGSGKTSLLMLLAGLEKATSGDVIVGGQRLNGLDEDDLARFRRRTVGIVFQSFHLIPSLSALDNVALALEIADPKMKPAAVREAAVAALTAVGLGERVHHRPAALSGGEQQRVGLARAMIARPRLLLADEPTGNLDQSTGAMVIELMFDLARKQGTAVVLITHDPQLAARADRVWTMTQGELVETQPVKA